MLIELSAEKNNWNREREEQNVTLRGLGVDRILCCGDWIVGGMEREMWAG